MFAYLEIRREERDRTEGQRTVERARQAELELKHDEERVWAQRR